MVLGPTQVELFHNTRRRHGALGMLSPSDFEAHYLKTTEAARLENADSDFPGVNQDLQGSRGDFNLRKRSEVKTDREARRVLKRHLSDVVYRHLNTWADTVALT